jgi:phospholipid/cholesterol/gamma-HCH transport system substrate-binding protein
MENKAYALAAGMFTLLLGAALVAAALWFGKDDVEYVPFLVTTTTSVAGLKSEAPVRYRGVEVGRVKSIHIEPGVNGHIHIRVGVTEGTPVTKSTFARLGYQGVTGLAYVALDDSGDSKELLKSTARKPAEIPLRRSIMDTGEDLMTAFGEVATRVKTLLDEDNQVALRRALVGLEKATLKTAALADKTAVLAEKLQPGVAGVPGLVGDARGAIGNANQLIGNLNGLTAKIEERVEALNRVAKSVEEVGSTARAVNDETLPRLNALVEDLHKETRALDRLLTAIGEHPQSIVFGAPPGKPGPGERGFSAGGAK